MTINYPGCCELLLLLFLFFGYDCVNFFLELGLEDLADVREREFVADFKAFRPLELGETHLRAVLFDVVEGDLLRLVPQGDEQAALFAKDLVRHGDERGVMHSVVLQNDVLDFFAAELLTAAVDGVLDAAHDREAASARMHGREVAGAVVAVFSESLLVVLRLLVVGTDRIRAAEHDFTRLVDFAYKAEGAAEVAVLEVVAARDDFACILVEDLPFVSRRAAEADGLEYYFFRIAEHCVRDDAFGHTELGDKPARKFLLHAAGDDRLEL